MNLLALADKKELLKLKPLFRINVVFPHISEKILDTWGTFEFNNYMQDLFLNSRPNPRQGFPDEALKDLYRIFHYHNKVFSEFLEEVEISKVHDVWNS